jgi:UPF0755 protein
MESRSLRTIMLVFIGLGVLALLCGGVAFFFAGDQIADVMRNTTRELRVAQRADDLERPLSDDTTPVQFAVAEGEGAGQIAQKLNAQNLVSDGDLFVDYIIIEDLDSRLGTGTYFLNRAMNIKDVAVALTGTEYRAIDLTVFGGQRIEEIAAMIDAIPRFEFTGADFLATVGRGAQVDPAFAQYVGLPAGASLEGFLLPGRYVLAPDITALMLRDRLVNAFLDGAGGEINNLAAEQGYSLYEVVTLASIVQREALYDDERPLIAGVYRNRLERPDPDTDGSPPMRLNADPTVQYPLGEPGNWWPQITVSDYQGVDSSYNTYRVIGLPPGPIANPSLTSIRAVVEPEDSDFFYFRADCRTDGYHDFAPNYQEHLANGC